MHHKFLNRRTFLKASLVGAFLLFSGPAFAEIVYSGESTEGNLRLFNIHTNERLEVCYRDDSGNYDHEALSELNNFLRCHHTQEVIQMDMMVIEFINMVDKRLGGGNEIHIISGFRSPEYNNMLIREGRKVVKNSLHLLGKAIDVYFPRIPLNSVRQAALDLRLGGVGYYPKSGFVHLDSGRFRYW